MATVYIGVGSNIGNRQDYLDRAKNEIKRIPNVQWLAESSIHETDPVGGPEQGRYLNAVWKIQTDLKPESLFRRLMAIERMLGRVRTIPNGPRTIDLDVLSYDARALKNGSLTIPHSRMHEREFVLRPFSEIDPNWVHPILKKDVSELLEELFAYH